MKQPTLKVKIINKSKHELPKYKTPGSAGADLRANIDEPVRLQPGERALVPTGIHIELPVGYEGQVRGRSGNAIKLGVGAHLGTIDSDYRGDIGVIIFNNGYEPVEINDGDRIGQLVIKPVVQAEWEEVEELTDTERGENGYGHTGIK